MARAGSHISTARALMRAGVTPASQPTGSAVSPLVQSLGQWGVGPTGRGAVPVMPRPADVFDTGAFGPGAPLWPMAIDTPDKDGVVEPRRTEYPVFWNLPVGVPGSEGLGKRASFGMLRGWTDQYNIARRCVEARKKELLGLEWDIIPTETAAEAMKGSIAAKTDWESRKAKVMDYMTRPDRSPDSPYESWWDWMEVILEDRYVIDAVSIYLHPPIGGPGSGWMGSNVGSLDYIDGSTIRPLYDLRGGTPPPSAPAFQQFLWGVPRTDYATWSEGKDLEELGGYVDEFKYREMMYLRMTKRGWTPYGMSPIEQAITPIQIGLARQNSQLQFWTEGSVPYLYVVPGADLIQSPQQVRQLQNALNGIAGDTGWKQKVIVLPPGSDLHNLTPSPLADQFDEYIVGMVTANFGMSPQDLGIAPKVASAMSPAAGKAVASAASQNSQDHWLEPETQALQILHNHFIQKLMKQNDMRFRFTGLDEPEDESQKLQDATAKFKASLCSLDEARAEVGMDALDSEWSQMPLVFTGDGAMFLSTAVEQADFEYEQAQKVPDALVLAPWAPGTPPGAPGAPAGPGGTPAKPGPGAKPASGTTDETGEHTTPMHEAAENVQDKKPTSPSSGGTSTAQPKKPASAKAQLAELDILKRIVKKGRDPYNFVAKELDPEVLNTFLSDHESMPFDEAIQRAEQRVMDMQKFYVADLTLAYHAGQISPVAYGSEIGRLTTEGVIKTMVEEKTDADESDVYDYLAKNYPEEDLGWVKGCTWELKKVALDDINMARRPGGRDMDKVNAIAQQFADGKEMPPIVLVDSEPKMTIADGYHRTLGAQHAGVDSLMAYVSSVPKADGWEDTIAKMHADKLNKVLDDQAEALWTAISKRGGDHAADTERLMRYWAEGVGAGKIGWGVDGDYDRCRAHLGKHVPPKDLNGLCSNLHERATGARPGHAPGESHSKSSIVIGGEQYEVLDIDLVIEKVGPKGYIHGWIFVGVPVEGQPVFHSHFGGHGTVSRVRDFGNGHKSVNVHWHGNGNFTQHDAYGEHAEPHLAPRGPEHPEFDPKENEPEPPHVPEPEPPKETDAQPHVTTRTPKEIEDTHYRVALASDASPADLRAMADNAHKDSGTDPKNSVNHLARERGYRRAADEKEAKLPNDLGAIEENAYNEAKDKPSRHTALRQQAEARAINSDPANSAQHAAVARGLHRAVNEASAAEETERNRRYIEAWTHAQGGDLKDASAADLRQRAGEIETAARMDHRLDPASEEAHRRLLAAQYAGSEARALRDVAREKEEAEAASLLAGIQVPEPPSEGFKKLSHEELKNHTYAKLLKNKATPSRAQESAEKYASTHEAHLFKDGTLVTFNEESQAPEMQEGRDALLQTTAELREKYPEHAPHHIQVGESAGIGYFNGSWGNTYVGSNVIGINPMVLGDVQRRHDEAISSGWWMPGGAGQHPGRTVLQHEFGHTMDVPDGAKRPPGVEGALRGARKNRGYDTSVGISRYGMKNMKETYAEAFMEWESTKGQTTNQSIRALAAKAGWRV